MPSYEDQFGFGNGDTVRDSVTGKWCTVEIHPHPQEFYRHRFILRLLSGDYSGSTYESSELSRPVSAVLAERVRRV